MGSSAQSAGPVATRYASALIDTAQEKGNLDKVEADIKDLSSILDESQDLRDTIRNPLYSRLDQENVLTALAEKAKFQDITRNFLALLAMNRRQAALPAILVRFREELAARRGEMKASVQVAQDLSAKQRKKLEDNLSKAFGAKVNLNIEIQQDLLGGMVVTVGSTMIDDSVKSKLERLKSAMKNRGSQQTANQNTPKEEAI